MKLLLIEDDFEIAQTLSQALAHDYTVLTSANGQQGLRLARSEAFDTIILDLNLPDINGLQVCQRLRQAGCQSPVLILSAESQVLSKIKLLDSGADDYLTKPFRLGELKARLRVLQRRFKGSADGDPRLIRVGSLALDTVNSLAIRDKKTIALRRKEYAILECLMSQPGSPVSRISLANYAWTGASSPLTNSIDVHIKALRDKIDRPYGKNSIRTAHGIGYQVVDDRALKAKILG